MEKIKPIRTGEDYAAALARIEALMDAKPGTSDGDELDVLTDLVELYETKNVPFALPDPISAIEFRMDQAGLTLRDLVPFIGSRAKVSEVLSGKRSITMPMARALHEHLGIPADVLLQSKASKSEASLETLELDRLPLNAMVKLGWISKKAARKPMEVVADLIRRAGGHKFAVAVLYRKNDLARSNAKTDPQALRVWCLQLLAVASENKPITPYKPGTVTLEFLQQVVRLSWSDDGPKLAQHFLKKHGIVLVVLPHLPRTHLDGAALKLSDGTPVIGLTLRYDRLDNFWFCLLHELAHIGRHMVEGNEVSFVDDLTLRESEVGERDKREVEADEWAEEASIPKEIWDASDVKVHPTTMMILNLAKTLQIHPAIIAGRVRFELKNYRLLSHFVGTGEVRKHFETFEQA